MPYKQVTAVNSATYNARYAVIITRHQTRPERQGATGGDGDQDEDTAQAPRPVGPARRSTAALRSVGEDEGCVLQGCEPAWAVGAHQFRLPRLYLPGSPGSGTEWVLCELSSGHQQPGEEGEGSADQGLAPQPSHGHGPVRHRTGHQSPGARLD